MKYLQCRDTFRRAWRRLRFGLPGPPRRRWTSVWIYGAAISGTMFGLGVWAIALFVAEPPATIPDYIGTPARYVLNLCVYLAAGWVGGAVWGWRMWRFLGRNVRVKDASDETGGEGGG